VLNQQVRKGLSKHAAAVFRSEISGYIVEANRQLGHLRVKIKGSDLAAIKRGLRGTVDDTRAAFTQLFADAARLGCRRRRWPAPGRPSRRC
jgi:hypothetical protein